MIFILVYSLFHGAAITVAASSLAVSDVELKHSLLPLLPLLPLLSLLALPALHPFNKWPT